MYDALLLAQVVIQRQICPLGLVQGRFETTRRLEAQDPDAARWQRTAEGILHRTLVLMLYKVANPYLAAQFEERQRHLETALRIRRIIQGSGPHIAPPLQNILYEDISLALVLHDVCLQPQRILIERDQLVVPKQFERRLGQARKVAADHQRRAHDAPHAEVHLLLGGRQAAAYLQHVHVVVVAAAGIGRQVEVLAYDGLHRAPVGRYVAAYAPRARQVARPRAGEGPAADVDRDVFGADLADGLDDGRVTLALVEVELLARAAVVDLDEVEAPLVEIEVGILLLVPVEPHAHAVGVGIPQRTAGVGARVGVDTRPQAKAVDMVDDALDAVGEAFGVGLQHALLVAVAEEAVVDVDIAVAGILQPERHHGIGLAADKLLADVYTVGVPRAPPHDGRLDALRAHARGRHHGRRCQTERDNGMSHNAKDFKFLTKIQQKRGRIRKFVLRTALCG